MNIKNNCNVTIYISYIFIVICMCLSSLNSSAQNITTRELCGTKWKSIDDDEILEFESDSIIETSCNPYTKRIIRIVKPYYLTENKNEAFDDKKVGTVTEGRFLLQYNYKINSTEYCEITELTEDKLVLFFEAKDHYVGAADISFTYKRVH